MKVIKQYWLYENQPKYDDLLTLIENSGRTCYKTEPKGSPEVFISSIIKRGHLSVLEHGHISVRMITDRGVTHELVRHRIASYSQESTRYCDYYLDKFGKEITFILPVEFYSITDDTPWEVIFSKSAWESLCYRSEDVYKQLREWKCTPQLARAVLPNSLKTEIVVTMNLREWRHFFELRCSKAAHPQMREIANSILSQFKVDYPVFFEDIIKE